MSFSKHFIIQEFVPKGVWDSFGDSSIWFLDPRIISVADLLREHFQKPVIINDWHNGGSYYESGFRVPESTTGARYSQHRFGRAIDIKIPGLTPQQVYDEILANESLFRLAGLSAMENINATPTWLHADVRNSALDKILIVNP